MEKVEIPIGNWLLNAGLTGFYSILKEEKEVKLNEQENIEITPELLENFHNKYFKYCIGKYEKTLSWNRIVSYQDIIEKHLNENFENFNEEDLNNHNTYVKDILKKYLKSNSYAAAFDLIKSEVEPLKLEKEISVISLKKNEKLDDIKEMLKENFQKIAEVIKYCKSEEGKKYIAGKNVVYSFINKAWSGISFLNPKTKEKNMYEDYKKYFVDEAVKYLKEDKIKFKYNCSCCGNKIKNLSNTLSFLNKIGFDVGKKSSHVWNFNNDLAVCPVCKLIYSCASIGFNYTYDKGIFINANHSLNDLYRINKKIEGEMIKNIDEKAITYRALNNALYEQAGKKIKFELADVQIITYKNESYKFNMLSKKVIKIIKNSKDELESLIKTSYPEGNITFNLYEEVMKRLLNNQNMYSLVHKLLYFKLAVSKGLYYNGSHIFKIMGINFRILKGAGYMGTLDEKSISDSKASGYYLREKYKKKGADNKLGGICYRLLNALKTNNVGSFMDVLLNCYLYTGDAVPKIFTEILSDDDKFKVIGYAFVAGMIDEKKTDDNNKGGNS